MTYTISDFRRDYRAGPFAWPGGYPRFFVLSDGEPLSFEAAKTERRAILEALREGLNNGWRPIGADINWEDADLYCVHTGKPIPAAYAP